MMLKRRWIIWAILLGMGQASASDALHSSKASSSKGTSLLKHASGLSDSENLSSVGCQDGDHSRSHEAGAVSLPSTPLLSPYCSQDSSLTTSTSSDCFYPSSSGMVIGAGKSHRGFSQQQLEQRDIQEVRTLLTFDGGGGRGYISMLILNALEQEMRRILGDQSVRVIEGCDLVGGTSAGAIAASVLTKEDPKKPGRPKYDTETMLAFFEEGQAAEMFKKSWYKEVTSGLGLFDEKYSSTPLKKALKGYVGKAKLREACVPTFITTFELSNTLPGSAPRLFTSYAQKDDPFYDVTACMAAMASGAAPTYFERVAILSNILNAPQDTLTGEEREELVKTLMKGMLTAGPEFKSKIMEEAKNKSSWEEENTLEQDSDDEGRCPPLLLGKKRKKSSTYKEHYFIDGGMIGANDPTIVGLGQLWSLHPSLRRKNMEVISIGTGVAPMLYNGEKAANWGLLAWLQPIITIALNAPTQTNDLTMQWFFRKGGYTRWSPTLQKKISLDELDEQSLQTMKEITLAFIDEHQDEIKREAHILAARYKAKRGLDQEDRS